MQQLSHRQQLGEADHGSLFYFDHAPAPRTEDDCDEELRKIGSECVAHFLQEFWRLPTYINDHVRMTTLPAPTFQLPREKPCPTQKPLTKWEEFARTKGIQKKKRSRMVWDDVSQSYKPRYGRGRIDDVKDKWCLEVPGNADPFEDQFEKLNKQRRERKAKNELARLKNISRHVKGGKAPPVGVLSESLSTKNEVTRALNIAKTSNASLGRFSGEINEAKVKKSTEKRVLKKDKKSNNKGMAGGRPAKKGKPFQKGSRTGKAKQQKAKK